MLLHQEGGKALMEMFRVLKVGRVQSGRGFLPGFEKTFQKGAGEDGNPLPVRTAEANFYSIGQNSADPSHNAFSGGLGSIKIGL